KMKKGHILKQKIMDEIKDRIEKNNTIILTDISTLSVDEITRLRREFSKIDAKYVVAKNRLFMRAAKDLDIPISPRLTGSTGFLFSKDAPISCKTLLGFIKKEKKPSIKYGFLDKKRIEKIDIERIANLPSREALISQVISQIQAPIASLVYTLSGIIRNLLSVLDAIKEKKKAI
ncbi:MAG: 50S ribosomal protein L10, partial [bacterium]